MSRKQSAKQKPGPAADQVAQVFTWILAGHRRADIEAAIAEKIPGADAEALIKTVVKELEKAADTPPKAIVGFCIEGIREAYRRAVEAGDNLAALRALGQLQGIAEAIGKRRDREALEKQHARP